MGKENIEETRITNIRIGNLLGRKYDDNRSNLGKWHVSRNGMYIGRYHYFYIINIAAFSFLAFYLFLISNMIA